MSEEKYGLPWGITTNNKRFVVIDCEGNEIAYGALEGGQHHVWKYIVSCVNAFKSKEPELWEIVEKGTIESMEHVHKLEVRDLLCKYNTLKSENADGTLQMRFDEVLKYNHGLGGEIQEYRIQLAQAREGLEKISQELKAEKQTAHICNMLIFIDKRLAALDKPEGESVLDKVKELFIKGEACNKCCPCSCRETCPHEELYQECKQILAVTEGEKK